MMILAFVIARASLVLTINWDLSLAVYSKFHIFSLFVFGGVYMIFPKFIIIYKIHKIIRFFLNPPKSKKPH
jgi:hypothetical protein